VNPCRTRAATRPIRTPPHRRRPTGKRLYVSFGSRGLFCYDLDGNRLWDRDLGRMITRLGWGEGASPVIHGDNLIVNWDHEGQSFLVVLNPATGETKWRVERDEVTSWTTPLAIEYQGGRS
jgi:outer membrane protein assembly factor BamB